MWPQGTFKSRLLGPQINLWAVLSDLSDRTLVSETASQLAAHYWHYLIYLDIYIISHIHTHTVYKRLHDCILHAWILLSRGVWKKPTHFLMPFFSVFFFILWESTRCHYVDILWASSSESGRSTAVERFLKKNGGSSMWTPRPTIYKWMFQLDDEPNLYIENGWKSPFPSIYKWLALGFQAGMWRKNHPF